MSKSILNLKAGQGKGLYAEATPWYSQLPDYRMDTVAGLDNTLWSIFGKDNIKAIAAFIDPLAKFKPYAKKVSPVNRTKKLWTGIQRDRVITTLAKNNSRASTPIVETANPWDYRFPGTESTNTSTSTSVQSPQPAVCGFRKDTSRRTRAVGVDQGEFELFVPRLYSHSRGGVYIWNKTSALYTAPFDPYNYSESTYLRDTRISGPAAVVQQFQLDALSASESSAADQLISKYALGLLKDALPSSRKASLAKTVIEFRDLLDTVKGSVEGVMAVVGKHAKLADLGSGYLNEKFGWENTIQDLNTLLFAPDEVTRRVNYLLTRQWKPTTFRARKRFLLPLGSPPSFAYSALDSEFQNTTSTNGSKIVELKVCVNCNVDFPELRGPNAKFGEFSLTQRIGGSILTINDIYQLIPWTWLGDWFVSTSDYLEAIETVNADDSIVNYAFASYKATGYSKTEYNATVTCSRNDNVDGHNTDRSFILPIQHASICGFTYEKRKNLATSLDVRPSWDLTKFSGAQLSILSALAAART
jgi:hypothetical protein